MGFALDLGTTSLAGVIVDLQTGKILAKASGGNGQIRYGASRWFMVVFPAMTMR